MADIEGSYFLLNAFIDATATIAGSSVAITADVGAEMLFLASPYVPTTTTASETGVPAADFATGVTTIESNERLLFHQVH